MNADQPIQVLKRKQGDLRYRDRWASSFQPPQELWRLEFDEARDLCLYMSKVRVIQDRWNPKHNTEDPHGRAPMYHVWHGDQWLYCGASMQAAYHKYNEIQKGGF